MMRTRLNQPEQNKKLAESNFHLNCTKSFSFNSEATFPKWQMKKSPVLIPTIINQQIIDQLSSKQHALLARLSRTFWGWLTGSPSGKGWDKVACSRWTRGDLSSTTINHGATSSRNRVWMQLEKQLCCKEATKQLRRGLELPNDSTFHYE